MSAVVTQAVCDRFWAKVDRRGPDECWLWIGARGSTNSAYGRFTIQRGITRPAHQVSWEIANGAPFPRGLVARHKCDNPPCVNPAHIEPGTQSQNLRDCVERGRHKVRPHDFCKRGHALTPENRKPASEQRRCKECARISARKNSQRYRQRLKEAAQND